MLCLQKYITKTVIYSTAVTTFIMSAVLFLMTFLTELKNVGEGDYGFKQALEYVLMHMPTALYQFAPMLILLGTIAGLSILTSYRELSVMRSSGFSVWQIIQSVLFAALMLTLAISIAGEWLAPNWAHRAEIDKSNFKNGGQAVMTNSGIWLHVDNNFIHIDHIVDKQLLQGVTRYQFDNKHHLLATYYAKSLSYDDNHWVMQDVVKTQFQRDGTTSEVLAAAPWDLPFNSNLLKIGVLEPKEMSLIKLNRFAAYLEKNGLRSSEYRFELWQRLLQPIASLLMVFLAIPFVLGSIRGTNLGWRIVIGVIIGFVFFITNSLLGQVCVVYQVPAFFAASVPLLLFLVAGIFWSRHMLKQ